MKNQYFGDNRDLFKYDLVQHIVDRGLVSSFTFIPMLTGKRQTDRRLATAGKENKRLVGFLDGCLKRRNITELYKLFPKGKARIYEESKEFSHQKREQYFDEIDRALLSKALILVDPDTGLEPPSGAKKEHIRYHEVKTLYDRMDRSSILMIFQYFPREERKKYFAEICRKLKKEVEKSPIYISDKQIVFFFLTRNESLGASLRKVIRDYGESYQLDFGDM